MRFVRSLASVVAATALLMGATVALSSPAQAASATACKVSSRSFDLPKKPDVTVKLKICIKRTGVKNGYRYYQAWLQKAAWDGTSSFTGGKRFNEIGVAVRAESGSTTRTTCSGGICEDRHITSEVNGKEKGSKSYKSGGAGYGVVFVKTKKKNWTADATAYVDIANDGKSGKKWGLTGTKRVS